MMQLLQNETIVTSSVDKSVILTNQRLLVKSNPSQVGYSSIQLQNISAITAQAKNNYAALFSGILLVPIGTILLLNAHAVLLISVLLPFVAGSLLVLLYFTTKRIEVRVDYGQNQISFFTKGVSKSEVEVFVNKIEREASKVRQAS